MGGRSAIVFKVKIDDDLAIGLYDYDRWIYSDIGSEFGNAVLFPVLKRNINQTKTSDGNEDAGPRGDKSPERPSGGILLGLKLGFSALLICSGIILCFGGYYCIGKAVNAIRNGHGIGGWIAFALGPVISTAGGFLAMGVCAYWISHT